MKYIQKYEKYDKTKSPAYRETQSMDLIEIFQKLLNNLYQTYINGNEIAIDTVINPGFITYHNYIKIEPIKSWGSTFQIIFYGDMFEDIIKFFKEAIIKNNIPSSTSLGYNYYSFIFEYKHIPKLLEMISELEQSEEFQIYVSTQKYNL